MTSGRGDGTVLPSLHLGLISLSNLETLNPLNFRPIIYMFFFVSLQLYFSKKSFLRKRIVKSVVILIKKILTRKVCRVVKFAFWRDKLKVFERTTRDEAMQLHFFINIEWYLLDTCKYGKTSDENMA